MEIGGFCSATRIQPILGERSLVLCDCVGSEWELLDRDRVPAPRNADILVEMHDFFDASISQILLSRMSASQEIRVYKGEVRCEAAVPPRS